MVYGKIDATPILGIAGDRVSGRQSCDRRVAEVTEVGKDLDRKVANLLRGAAVDAELPFARGKADMANPVESYDPTGFKSRNYLVIAMRCGWVPA